MDINAALATIDEEGELLDDSWEVSVSFCFNIMDQDNVGGVHYLGFNPNVSVTVDLTDISRMVWIR